MLRLISTTTVAVLTAITMSTTDVQADKLPASVSSQLQIAAGPDQVALLAIANPKLSASIMEEAAALGVATPAQVIGAAATSEASPEIIMQLTRAAAMISPLDGSTAVASAAEVCVITGGEISDEIEPALASAVVDGVETSGALAEVVESEAAQILSALQGWCRKLSTLQEDGQNQLAQFRETILDDLPSEAQNNPSPN